MEGKRQALIDRRKELGYSQYYMADLLGIARVTYYRIENGTNNPSIEICINIGKILGMNGLALMNSIDHDLNIYDKSESLKLIWVFFKNNHVIDMVRVEDSKGE